VSSDMGRSGYFKNQKKESRPERARKHLQEEGAGDLRGKTSEAVCREEA